MSFGQGTPAGCGWICVPSLPFFREEKGGDGDEALFFMQGQLEPLGEQGSHQQAHLVLARTALRAGLDIEVLGGHPAG
jgi:hypothetical protein